MRMSNVNAALAACAVAVAVAAGGCSKATGTADPAGTSGGTGGTSNLGGGAGSGIGTGFGSGGTSGGATGGVAAGGTSGNGGASGGNGGNGGSAGAAMSGSSAGAAMSGGAAGSSSAGGATFTAVYAILMANCSGPACHVGAFFAGAGLSMPDKMTAYTNLVGAASSKCSGQQRVVAGNANASVLVQSLEHKGGCAPAMPQGRAALSQADIDTIVAWINAGALND
jgi:hypothetical protein